MILSAHVAPLFSLNCQVTPGTMPDYFRTPKLLSIGLPASQTAHRYDY